MWSVVKFPFWETAFRFFVLTQIFLKETNQILSQYLDCYGLDVVASVDHWHQYRADLRLGTKIFEAILILLCAHRLESLTNLIDCNNFPCKSVALKSKQICLLLLQNVCLVWKLFRLFFIGYYLLAHERQMIFGAHDRVASEGSYAFFQSRFRL